MSEGGTPATAPSVQRRRHRRPRPSLSRRGLTAARSGARGWTRPPTGPWWPPASRFRSLSAAPRPRRCRWRWWACWSRSSCRSRRGATASSISGGCAPTCWSSILRADPARPGCARRQWLERDPLPGLHPPEPAHQPARGVGAPAAPQLWLDLHHPGRGLCRQAADPPVADRALTGRASLAARLRRAYPGSAGTALAGLAFHASWVTIAFMTLPQPAGRRPAAAEAAAKDRMLRLASGGG